MSAADVITTLERALADLEACDSDDYVLAWDYGLGVTLASGKPCATSLDKADTIATGLGTPEEAWAFAPNVFNGHGVAARVVRRQTAIARHAADLRRMIEGYRRRQEPVEGW